MSFIKLDNYSFHYHHYNVDGTDLVLLHGLASNLNIWNLVAPVLSQNFNVYTLDQRGHGLSSKPDIGYDFDSIIIITVVILIIIIKIIIAMIIIVTIVHYHHHHHHH